MNVNKRPMLGSKRKGGKNYSIITYLESLSVESQEVLNSDINYSAHIRNITKINNYSISEN